MCGYNPFWYLDYLEEQALREEREEDTQEPIYIDIVDNETKQEYKQKEDEDLYVPF